MPDSNRPVPRTTPTDRHIDSGMLRGRRDGDVVTWQAIPYAAPPVGEFRFRAPQPVTPWLGVRDATRFRYAALSHPLSSPLGATRRQPQSEDCLTLNVCAPAEPGATPRPVLVFIHGGGYFEGSSGWPIYDPKPLVRRGDVVLVTINYRLNGLGFVDFSAYSTPERQFESNLGLRDQIAALRWVRDNIAAFGGDPNAVTIFGESAGGCSVTTLVATPAAAGLFHRAIAQSAPVDLVHTQAFAAEVAERCLANLGATKDTAAAVLSSATGRAISTAALKLMLPMMRQLPGRIIFAPVVDGDLLPETPLSALTAGRAARVPLILGTNRDELRLHGRFAPVLPGTVARIDRMFAGTNFAARDTVLAGYPGLPGTATALQCGTDLFFLRPTLAAAQAHAAHAPTYVYRFDYASPLLRTLGIGAFHGLDLFPVFGITGKWGARILTAGGAAAATRLTAAMQGHWLAFAGTGAPLPDWPAYDTETRSTLIFDDPVRVVEDLDPEVRVALGAYPGPYVEMATTEAV